jgi:hypothetical protein
MWAAYAFSLLAFVGLPSAIKQGTLAIVQWVAQTFLQLVLLSVIMVGQDVAAGRTETIINDTHEKVVEIVAEVREEQRALKIAQQELLKILVRVGKNNGKEIR